MKQILGKRLTRNRERKKKRRNSWCSLSGKKIKQMQNDNSRNIVSTIITKERSLETFLDKEDS